MFVDLCKGIDSSAVMWGKKMKHSMWVEWQNSVTHGGLPFGGLHSHMSCHNGSVEWGYYSRLWFSMAMSPYSDPKAKKCPEPLPDFSFLVHFYHYYFACLLQIVGLLSLLLYLLGAALPNFHSFGDWVTL